MISIRKWLYKPRRDDKSLFAKFWYADDNLNRVAAELDSFDGRKDPERCAALVSRLRSCQDKLLNICNRMLDELEGPEGRANREFRVKFPDEIVTENLGGQLWFGAECLAAGSSIMQKEFESVQMRPLAKTVTKTLEKVRGLIREQCLSPAPTYTEQIHETLKIFDRMFAEFEFSYVSCMVHVKTIKEYEIHQDVICLFSETLQRSIKNQLVTQDMVDLYDPSLMFAIPRLAIVTGLLIFPNGPLNVDRDYNDFPELFRPFKNLLRKIRELLWTLTPAEFYVLERLLCQLEEPEDLQRKLQAAKLVIQQRERILECKENQESQAARLDAKLSSLAHIPCTCDSPTTPTTMTTTTTSVVSPVAPGPPRTDAACDKLDDEGPVTPVEELAAMCLQPSPAATLPPLHQQSPADNNTKLENTCVIICDNNSTATAINDIIGGSSRSSLSTPNPTTTPHVMGPAEARRHRRRHHHRSHHSHRHRGEDGISIDEMAAVQTAITVDDNSNADHIVTEIIDEILSDLSTNQPVTTNSLQPVVDNVETEAEATLATTEAEVGQLRTSRDDTVVAEAGLTRRRSVEDDVERRRRREERRRERREEKRIANMSHAKKAVVEIDCSGPDITVSPVKEIASTHTKPGDKSSNSNGPPTTTNNTSTSTTSTTLKSSSSSTSSIDRSAARKGLKRKGAKRYHKTWKDARARFKSSEDLVHRLYVCISGAADQLQTNFAGDFRHILKFVFLVNSTQDEEEPEDPPSNHTHLEDDEEDEQEEEEVSLSLSDSESLGSPEVDRPGPGETPVGSGGARPDPAISFSTPARNSVFECGEDALMTETEQSFLRNVTGDQPPPSPAALVATTTTNATNLTTSSATAAAAAAALISASPPTLAMMPVYASNLDQHLDVALLGEGPHPPHTHDGGPHHHTHPHLNHNHQTDSFYQPEPTLLTIASGAQPQEEQEAAGRSRCVEPAPAWIPDSMAPICMGCGATFSLVRRRHHCRSCGRVFCNRCSPNQVPLPRYGMDKPVRVCNRCYIYYMNPYEERTVHAYHVYNGTGHGSWGYNNSLIS